MINQQSLISGKLNFLFLLQLVQLIDSLWNGSLFEQAECFPEFEKGVIVSLKILPSR
jgi:hypothetical protein